MTTPKIENLGALLGCLGAILFICYGLAQIVAGFAGIQHHLGTGWAIGIIVASLILRFSLPITIGAFFGALNVWHWHWLGAALFAAPGLLFLALLLPGAFSYLSEKLRR